MVTNSKTIFFDTFVSICQFLVHRSLGVKINIVNNYGVLSDLLC